MKAPRMNVLAVGATGSIGRLVVDEAIRQGHAVRDMANMPLDEESQRVRDDLEAVTPLRTEMQRLRSGG